jgi:hypothetical protein
MAKTSSRKYEPNDGANETPRIRTSETVNHEDAVLGLTCDLWWSYQKVEVIDR